MATIANGTYIIRNGAHNDQCLYNYSSTDDWGNNVIAIGFDNADSAYTTVINNSDGTIRLIFPATGLSLDVYCGGEDEYVTEGQNVRDWEWNDSRAQRWNVVAVSGKTYTYGGKSYQAYKLQMPGTINGKTWDMATASSSTTDAWSNTFWNVQITADKTADNVNWFFEPANPIVNGTYRIHPAANTDLVLDVSNASTANGAMVWTYAMNGSNAQAWEVSTDTSGRTKLYALHSGKLMEVAGDDNDVHNGSVVQQWEDLQGKNVNRDQQWIITPDSQTKYYDNYVPTYEIRNYASSGTGYQLDIKNDSGSTRLPLQLWEHNGAEAQQFYFEPYSALEPSLGTPANVFLAQSTKSQDYWQDMIANGATKWYCHWNCNGTTYKAKYRFRAREPSHTQYSSWSPWYSMGGHNLTANNGNGENWKPNLTVENTPQKTTSNPLTRLPVIDNKTYDCAEVQCWLERYETSWSQWSDVPCHGQAVCSTNHLVWQPNLTIDNVTWSPDGLAVSFKSDYLHGGNTIKFTRIYDQTQSADLFRGNVQFTNCWYQTTVTIPQEKLRFVPGEKDKLQVSMQIITDLSSNAITSTNTCAYDTNYGLSINPTYTPTQDGRVNVSMPDQHQCSCWLGYWDDADSTDHRRQIFGEAPHTWLDGNTRYWMVYPPIGKEYSIYVFAHDTSWKWGTDYHKFDAFNWHRSDPAFMWNWLEENKSVSMGAAVYLNANSVPTVSDELSADETTYKLVSRERPRYYMSDAVERKLDVDGVILDDYSSSYKYATASALRELENHHYALFRSYNGARAYVAVQKVTFDKSKPGYTSVSVSQFEDADSNL